MILLGLATAVSIQIVGALLVLSLLVTPAAAAMRVTASPFLTPLLSVIFAVVSVVGGILLALGGGCGILIAGSDYLGPQDDPTTLSEEEQKQCQAWWDRIAAATTQDAWRSTRKLYDAECRKPRERKPSG